MNLRRASLSLLSLGLWGVVHCGSASSHSQPGAGSSSGGVGVTDGGGSTTSGDGGGNIVFTTNDAATEDAAVDLCHVAAGNPNGNAPVCTKPPAPPRTPIRLAHTCRAEGIDLGRNP
jgi:hypothetical protein